MEEFKTLRVISQEVFDAIKSEGTQQVFQNQGPPPPPPISSSISFHGVSLFLLQIEFKLSSVKPYHCQIIISLRFYLLM